MEIRIIETWSNIACLGYVIAALERLGYPPTEIKKVVDDIKYAGFNHANATEAAEHYIDGPY